MLLSNPSLRYRRSAAALFLSLLVALGCYAAFVLQAKALLAGQERLDQSNRTVRLLRDVRDDVLDMESGQRGFLLTGMESYLEPFHRGQKSLQEDLSALWDELPIYAPGDTHIIFRLAELSKAKELEMLRTVELRRKGAMQEALAIVKSNQGKQYMDEMQDLVETYSMKYRAQRPGLREGITRNLSQAQTFLSVGGIALLVLVGTAFLNLRIGAAQLKAAADRLALEATHDTLTGLPNRRYLEQWLAHALARGKRLKESVAALYLDLDGFAEINNSLGHEAGDGVLREVAKTLRASLRDSDFIARLGGDEFVVITSGLSEEQLSGLAEKLVDALSSYITATGGQVGGGVSVGVAVATPDMDQGETLIAKADKAMYEAKHGGKARFRFYRE